MWWLSVALAGSLADYQTAYLTAPGMYYSAPVGGWAGDVDHDGTSEIWIGSSWAVLGGWTGGPITWSGSVIEVFHGSSARASASSSWYVGQGDQANFGRYAMFEDFNGDGELDVAIGAAGRKTYGSSSDIPPARLHLWFGPLQPGVHWASSSDVVLVAGEESDAHFGPALTDVTGDGLPDVVVTLYGRAGLPPVVYVINGARAAAPGPRVRSLEAAAVTALTGDNPSDFVSLPRGVGDLDGDGLPEIALQYFLQDNLYVVDGAALAAGGAALLGDVSRVLLPGGVAAAAGDVDRDGFQDLVTTDHGSYPGARFVSGVDVMALAPGLTSTTVAASDLMRTDGFGYVREVANVGDMNGDGIPDWAAGERPRSYLPTGGDGGPGTVWLGYGEGAITYTGASRISTGERYVGPAMIRDEVGPWIAAGQDCDGDLLPDVLVPMLLEVRQQWALLCY